MSDKELTIIQKECDHDWEFFENAGVKQCTYPECQLERKLSRHDYEDLELRADFDTRPST